MGWLSLFLKQGNVIIAHFDYYYVTSENYAALNGQWLDMRREPIAAKKAMLDTVDGWLLGLDDADLHKGSHYIVEITLPAGDVVAREVASPEDITSGGTGTNTGPNHFIEVDTQLVDGSQTVTNTSVNHVTVTLPLSAENIGSVITVTRGQGGLGFLSIATQDGDKYNDSDTAVYLVTVAGASYSVYSDGNTWWPLSYSQ